jgi:hypothetical protein
MSIDVTAMMAPKLCIDDYITPLRGQWEGGSRASQPGRTLQRMSSVAAMLGRAVLSAGEGTDVVSEISGELARVSDAFEQPTLSLLSQRQAPVVVAILNTCFSRETRLVPTARLHLVVEGLLAEMATSGLADVPAGSGREVCLRWTNAQWLIRSTASDGSEVYSLTSHAQQALDFIANLRQERTGLSEHRIANIVATARRINRQSNPDRQSRTPC